MACPQKRDPTQPTAPIQTHQRWWSLQVTSPRPSVPLGASPTPAPSLRSHTPSAPRASAQCRAATLRAASRREAWVLGGVRLFEAGVCLRGDTLSERSHTPLQTPSAPVRASTVSHGNLAGAWQKDLRVFMKAGACATSVCNMSRGCLARGAAGACQQARANPKIWLFKSLDDGGDQHQPAWQPCRQPPPQTTPAQAQQHAAMRQAAQQRAA